jgi:hypothetical protein
MGLLLISAFLPFLILAGALIAMSWMLGPVMFIAGLVIAAVAAAWTTSMLAGLGASQPGKQLAPPSVSPEANAVFNAALELSSPFDFDLDEDLLATIVFGAIAWIFGIVAATATVGGAGAIAIGVVSFLLVFALTGPIAEENPEVMTTAQVVSLALSIAGIATSALGLPNAGVAAPFIIISVVFSLVALAQAYFGWPL